MTAEAPALVFDDVSVRLDDTKVLDSVTLEVGPGSVLALVGPNGAGKTTLIRTANGLVEPERGTVRLDDEPVATTRAAALARRVATVPQETTLGFDFDVRSIVAMGRTAHRTRVDGWHDGDDRAVTAALERTETAEFADRPVGSLSGGERQRVLMARALAQEAPVLLLDEPTASLDINHQVATLSMVRSLAAEGRTAVAAIHDLNLAARFCDEIALVADGSLVAVGPPVDVLTGANLTAAYGVETVVSEHPVTGAIIVTALADGDSRVPVSNRRRQDGPPETASTDR